MDSSSPPSLPVKPVSSYRTRKAHEALASLAQPGLVLRTGTLTRQFVDCDKMASLIERSKVVKRKLSDSQVDETEQSCPKKPKSAVAASEESEALTADLAIKLSLFKKVCDLKQKSDRYDQEGRCVQLLFLAFFVLN